MTLADLRDYFKNEFPWAESCTVGKADMNKETAVCFYNSRVPRPKITAFGGKKNLGSAIKPVTILLRYGRNASEAEHKATEIFNFFDEKTFFINEKRVFTISPNNSPIDLGTDDRGIYEYSFEFDFYEERKDE